MSSIDFLYYSIGISVFIFTGFVSYAVFNFTNTLKKVNLILERVDDITHDAIALVDGIKVGLVYMKNLLVRKGGDKHGRK